MAKHHENIKPSLLMDTENGIPILEERQFLNTKATFTIPCSNYVFQMYINEFKTYVHKNPTFECL